MKLGLEKSKFRLILLFTVATSLGLLTPEVVSNPSDHGESTGSVKTGSEKPNVILIDIDRLNSDRMPCYGYHRNTTPNLCEFGKENIMFKQAVSQAGWTAASITSVFTSQYTGTHGVENHGDSLDSEYVTMAEIMRSKGYRTAAFPTLTERAPSFIHRGYNLDQGFDNYTEGGYMLEENYGKFDKWEENTSKPYFAFIQGFDPHQYVNFDPPAERHYRTQERPEEFNRSLEKNLSLGSSDIVMENDSYYLRKKNDQLIPLEEDDIRYVHNQYDDSIRQADRSFGELISDLKEEDIYSESIIIVHANHGEMLDSRTFAGINRRFGHGQIWDDDIQVPLIIHLPEERDRTINRQVELIDILPTVIEEADINLKKNISQNFQGESLAPLYRDRLLSFDSYESEFAYATDHAATRTAVRNSSWKFVEWDSGKQVLYNLEKDPDENLNVISQYPAIAQSLAQQLDKHYLQNQRLKSKITEENEN